DHFRHDEAFSRCYRSSKHTLETTSFRGRTRDMPSEKNRVRDFWNRDSCGEALYLSESDRKGYEKQAKARYELEPYIADFARFEQVRGMRVLEIGVGLGADPQYSAFHIKFLIIMASS
ncbi:hypothetical protein, partial [Imhoffiella purpurea]|uniref:hypothetical protein n=1 Tax=Imhoffiella purpurea TaxID=1249627 RepID=UPI001E40CC5F